MQAAILTEPGRIDLRDIPMPEPGEGEVLVKIKAALTCGTDLKAFLRGHSLIPMPGPFGHEFSGVIVEKGKGVKTFREGDAIMAVHSAPCLSCAYCKKGIYNLCTNLMSTKALGAFAEYILLPQHVVRQNAFRKPEGLGFKEAAFLEPLACVLHGMEPFGIGKKDVVFVIGAGPIGLLHVLLAKAKGAKVLITGLEEGRLKTAKALGADLVFDPTQTIKSVRDLTGGIGVDYVFECTGQPGIWEAAVDYIRKGGTVVLFGGCKGGTTVRYKADRLHYDEITLRGTFHFTPDDVKRSYKLLKDRKINVRRLISDTYPLESISEVFGRLARGEGVKYALTP